MDNIYEIINGKKYKKCKENEIRNPLTKRCINKNKKTAKNLVIKDRPKYLYKYIKIRKEKQKSLIQLNYNETRLYIYKKIIKNMDNNLKIDENLILKNKINGEKNIYLSYLVKQPKYNISCKITLNNKNSENEIKYLKLVNNIVLNNKCPHFPLYYGNFDIKIKDEQLNILPKILKVDINKSYKIILTEIYDGNLKSFLKYFIKENNLILNSLAQIFIGIIFYYNETMSFYNNSLSNNFIYKKIESGGYYCYEIMGTKYYIENMGYIWMILNYENSIEFNKSIDKNIKIKIDFEKILYNFLPIKYQGFIKTNEYRITEETLNKILNIYDVIKYYSELYSNSGLKILISKILNILVSNGLIKKSIISSNIINKMPYKIK